MTKKQIPLLIVVVIIILGLTYLYTFVNNNTINVNSWRSWSLYNQVAHPMANTLQIKTDNSLSEKTVVDEEQPVMVNKDGFEIDVQMNAVSLKDGSPRSPNIILRETKSNQPYTLELQVGIMNDRHLQVAFIDLNQSDPLQRRKYIVSNLNSALITSDKLKIVEKSSGRTQSFSFYDAAANIPLAENIALPEPLFTIDSSVKLGLYVQSGDYDGALMTIKEFKLIPNTRLPHL